LIARIRSPWRMPRLEASPLVSNAGDGEWVTQTDMGILDEHLG